MEQIFTIGAIIKTFELPCLLYTKPTLVVPNLDLVANAESVDQDQTVQNRHSDLRSLLCVVLSNVRVKTNQNL